MQRYFFFILFLNIVIPSIALGIELNLDYPKFGPFDLNDNQKLPEIITWIYYFIVIIAGLAAFIMLVWGGVQWLLSGAIPAQASDARDKIRNALLGLLLVLASFLIVQLINPELTLFGGLAIDPVQGPAKQDEKDAEQGVFLAPPPRGATEPGIYFCANHQCRCNNQRAEKCKEGTANPGRGAGKDDYYRVGLEVVAEEFGEHRIIDIETKWRDEVRSVAIIPAFEGKLGSIDVVLFNGTEGKKEVICFSGTGAGRLDDYLLHDNHFLKEDNGWDDDPESFTAFYSSIGMCDFPGLTIDSIDDFYAQPVVFFFDKKDFGQRKGRKWWRPCKYFYAEQISMDGAHNNRPAYAPPDTFRGTGGGCEDQPGNTGDVYSVWISPNERCSIFKDEIIDPKPCTVTLYECGGKAKDPKDPCENLDPPPGANPEKYDRVCIPKSEGDLYQPQYSFDNQDLSNDIRNDIRAVEVKAIDDRSDNPEARSCLGIVVTPNPP